MKTISLLPLATGDATEVQFTLFASGKPQLTTGLQKLMQAAAFFVLTAKGSIPTYPDFGNSQVTALSWTQISLQQTYESLSSSVSELTTELTDYLAASTAALPDDERLGTLEITMISGNDDQLVLRLFLTSAAGESAIYDYNLFSETP